jgi:CDP-glycerol glycerophosphotransferase (TagB/SpsB family)
MNLTLIPLSCLAPRSPKAWAFGHIHDTFSGNSKYLYLWIVLNRPDIKVTWITGSRKVHDMLRRHGYPVALRWSVAGILTVLRARVFVSSHGLQHVNLQLSGGALYLNLWHGVGLKAIQFGDPEGSVSRAVCEAERGMLRRAALLEYVIQPDILVTTSRMMQQHFQEQFRLPVERVPQLGYPRNDVAVDPLLREAARIMQEKEGFRLNPGSFSEIYIYMPTFRDSGRSFVSIALPDLGSLSRALEKRNALFYFKPHPRTAKDFSQEYHNIKLWPNDVDFYPYLSDFDVLITDYSSVLYDYLKVRPLRALLYMFDLEEYQRNDRTLLYPLEENTAGLRVDNFDQLCRVLEQGEAVADRPSPRTDDVIARFWGGSPALSSPAIVNYVEKLLDQRGRRDTLKLPAAS